MSIWHVEVDCYSRTKPRAKHTHCCTRMVIVDAPNADEAMRIAESHASAKAPFGPYWVGFEATKCSNRTLPLIVGTWHHQPRVLVPVSVTKMAFEKP